MSDYDESKEPYLPVPPPESEEQTQWVPVCSVCGRMMRRELTSEFKPMPRRCDLHGEVEPRWERI